MRIRIGYLQFKPIFGRKFENLKRAKRILNRIRKRDLPTIICLPELFSTGYAFLNREELVSLAEEVPGETSEALLKIAQEKNLIICAGFPEKRGEKIFNSALLCFPDGRYHIYRKVHLFFREKELFSPGDEPFSVINFPIKGENLALGILICFDYMFPEAARTLALKKVQIILHPSNLILPYAPKITIARAIENRVFWVLANRVGIERRDNINLRFFGNSQIVAPDGKVLAKSGKREELVIVEIDPTEADAKKVTPNNDLILDRRPELYFR
ncbi:MAG: nitrilase-related carbon-nitrogen hydrolase [candidate division WOR-3 bacterium]